MKKTLLVAFVLASALCLGQTVCVQINNSIDDLEEQTDGSQYVDSSDLEFVYDINRGEQIVGMRFNGVSIPPDVLILEAYIQFTADEVDQESTSLNFQIENTDHAAPFGLDAFGLSSRTYLNQVITWNVPAWLTVGDAGVDQRSPNLSSLIQAIVDRPGFVSGNSLVIRTSGQGQRVAESYDGSPSLAPTLCISYASCGVPGTACDDGLSCTSNEVWTEHCQCIDFNDSDQDGVCDELDICPNVDDSLIGLPCNDGDPCTENDLWTSACECIGTLLPDSDGDGICDNLDLCPDFDDEVDIDDDGIPYCLDTCVDVNENGVCDDVDSAPINEDLSISHSHQRGFYDSPFQLVLFANKPNAVIRYTLDHSFPNSSTGLVYSGPIPITSTTVIRAIASLGSEETVVETRSFIFTADVISQSDPQGDFPVDVSLHSSFTQDPDYSQQFHAALRDIPSMSLSLDMSDYQFIYGTKGVEKQANIEFIDPQHHESFSSLSGVNTYGNSSFNSSNANKKNYRLKFKESFGASKLNQDLFGFDATDEFDVLDLRCGGQETIDRGGVQNIHEQLLKNLQLKISDDGVRGRFVHLYINSKYWGVYTLSERPNKSFAESYYGGDKEDYNVIKATCCDSNPLAIDGTKDSYDNMILETSNYSTVENYLDLQHFIDYVLICNYGPHGDWRTWNTYAFDNPSNGIPFKFYVWDPEPSLDSDWYYTNQIVNTRDHESIWQPLKANAEFRMNVADGLECNCIQEDGALYDANIEADYLAMFDENKRAYMMDCARWANLNLYDQFLNYRDNLIATNWFGNRRNLLIEAYKNNGLYSDLAAVVFSQHGGEVGIDFQLNLTNPNTTGTIYFTTDGSDPRSPGGGISSSATVFNQDVSLPQGVVTVKARVKDSNEWSAMCPRTYFVNQTYEGIVINEVHYNPKDSIFFNPSINAMDTVSGRNFEFIELKNTSNSPINLYGCAFTKGVQLKINEPLIIPPGGFAVFAEDAYWFEQKYGFSPDGRYTGKLSNSGEKINFKDPGGYFIDTLRYDQGGLWTNVPDQGLYSLALIDATADNSVSSNWFFQSTYSTPKAENIFAPQGPSSLVINEIHYNPISGSDAEFIELVNTSEQVISLQGISFTDGIDYSFNLPISLPAASDYPQNYLVLAKDFATFQSTYGFAPFDVYEGSLNNAGEFILLQDANGAVIDVVAYSDALPWDTVPDYGHHSLALLDWSENNLFPSSWSHNEVYLLSPGADNFPRCPEDFTADGIVDVSDFLELNTNFGLSCDGCIYDLTGDGMIDVSDFLAFNSYYGLTCPTHLQNQ